MNHCPECGARLGGKCANPHCERPLPAGSRADRKYCTKKCSNAVLNARLRATRNSTRKLAPVQLG